MINRGAIVIFFLDGCPTDDPGNATVVHECAPYIPGRPTVNLRKSYGFIKIGLDTDCFEQFKTLVTLPWSITDDDG